MARTLLWGVGLVLIVSGCSLGNTPSGDAGTDGGLNVTLSASPASGPAPLEVRFESSASSAEGGPLRYVWQIANRSLEGGANRGHTFVRAGAFEVGVSVSDGVATATDTVTVRVGAGAGNEPGNRAPSVRVGASPTVGTEDLAVAFSADASDPDGDALSYSWSFGDGTVSGSGSSASHEYDEEGTYTATVTVSDGRGGYGSDEVDIVVADNRGGDGSGDGDDDSPPNPPTPGGAPDIDNFTVSEDSTAAGTTVTLSWSLAGGQPTRLELSNNVSTEVIGVLGRSSVQVTPTQTTTYTLSAANAQGRDVERETVRVGDDGDDGDHGGGDHDDEGGDNGGGDDHGGGDDEDDDGGDDGGDDHGGDDGGGDDD